MSSFGSNQSESSSCFLARKRGKMAAWSMTSLITALPESPNSTHSSTYSDNATEFSTPRNQRLGIAYIDNNCLSDIDEWLEHANKFCKSFNEHLTETRRNGSPERDLRMSAVCNNFLTTSENELYNIILPSVREESPNRHTQTHLTSCINRYGGGRRPFKSATTSKQRTRLISKPKPYDEFLNEIRRKKLEADKVARNKAKHLQLMHRLRRKEEAINDWELQQTRKAMDHMDKIQACNVT
uniref:Uncharacterized protein LOC101499119 n=1 Tax=Cicer arietinum TaxID=3827 RepID=A0A3Q7YDP6_CICAR|nr:uncharacterized protein LOC101499119 [Cicer arietinum]